MKGNQNKAISNIRTFCMECISNVKSGHPGIALGAAPIMHTLYTKVLKQTSKDSDWFDRDRFILAAGHGSILLYTALHLSGYKIWCAKWNDDTGNVGIPPVIPLAIGNGGPDGRAVMHIFTFGIHQLADIAPAITLPHLPADRRIAIVLCIGIDLAAAFHRFNQFHSLLHGGTSQAFAHDMTAAV